MAFDLFCNDFDNDLLTNIASIFTSAGGLPVSVPSQVFY
jgi:hypothetical protein